METRAKWSGQWRSVDKRVLPALILAQGRMFSVQQTLPRLPVPPLQQTLDKFLLSVKPILSEDEFQHAEKVVRDFGSPGSSGEQLQKLLEERANKSINWLADWWLKVAYLDHRLPVVIHSSPGVTFPSQDFSTQEEQLRCTAKMISGILDYKVMVDDQSLEVEHLGGKPLCMMQFYNILSSCRIPGIKHDDLVNFPPDMVNPPRHIVVAHNNHFFSLDVYGSDKRPLTTDQLYSQLCHVVDKSRHPAIPVGLLTTEGRNAWGKTYTKLMKDKNNRLSAEEIKQCIFMVCLDQQMPQQGDRLSHIAGQMNHGWGSKYNTCNRWFDKSLQFIVGRDGAMGLNYEHSPAEGPPIISVIDHTLHYLSEDHPKLIPTPGMMEPRRLKFKLTQEVEVAIEKAQSSIDALVDDLDLTAFTFTSFGKEFVKSQKISPDAFIQVTLQLAYYRLYGCSVSSYESGSIRRFQHGRTDTIRSCSIASHKYCQVMDSSVSTSEKIAALRDAIASHRAYTNDVVAGQGIDRHLLGLKMIAIEHGLNVPDFFMDPIYTTSVHWKISTSQVPSKNNAVLCFGPVVPDGYGICYNPMPHKINFSVSAWNSSPETSSKKMKDSIIASLQDAQQLLASSQSIDSKL